MSEAAKTSSNYMTRLGTQLKETHSNCLEACILIEDLKDFYANILEEESKLNELKGRKDVIRLERLAY